MSEIRLEQRHNLGSSTAKQRFCEVEDKLKERFGITLSWDGCQATFKGSGVTGLVTIGDELVSISLKLGLLVRPFAAKIRESLERQLREKLGT